MTRWGWATWTLLLLVLATMTQGATAVAMFVMAVLTGAAAIYAHVMTMLVRREMARHLAEGGRR